MAITSNNRFALLEEDDDWGSSTSNSPTQEKYGSASPVLKSSPKPSRKAPLKTLVIRNETQHAPRNLNRPADNFVNHGHTHGTSTYDVRNVSNSSNGTETAYNPFENWCGVCQIKFSTKPLLLTHIRQTPKHENYCNLCKRVFKDRNGLQNHVDNTLGHDVFCNLCLSAFKDTWGLRNHFENNYAVGHEYACLTCLKGFKSHHDMGLHLRTVRKHVRCDTCHRDFRNQDERDGHWIKTTKHKHCLQPGCDFDAPSLNTLKAHLKDDHFQCEGCRIVFASNTKLMAHLEGCKVNVACNSCHAVFPGQSCLAAHQENCFCCKECDFYTGHEGNYLIHMTKHISATFACWACDAPMRTQSSLINHLESRGCPGFPDPAILTRTLGEWWYSPLYMDLDIHALVRRKAIDLQVLQGLISEGAIHPFVCRDRGCIKTFARFSSLVLHVESQACEWNTDRLGLEMLKKEVLRSMRKDIATQS